MKLKYCSPVIFVSNIEKSRDFYYSLTGLTIKHDFGKNVIFENNIALWEIRPNHIVASVYENKNSSPANRFELYFECDNIDEAEILLKKSGVKFLHEKHEELWGQLTIRFFDPDGNLIEIGETMPRFLRRFRDMGMTIEEISARTSVQVDDVIKMLSGSEE